MTQRVSSFTGETGVAASVILPAMIAMLLGCFILFGTGIVQASALHNAAHDSRHSFAFPCH